MTEFMGGGLRSPFFRISRAPSSVFMLREVFLTVSCKLRVQTMLSPCADLKPTLTWAMTSLSLDSRGSWMKAPPTLVLGGSSPVVASVSYTHLTLPTNREV